MERQTEGQVDGRRGRQTDEQADGWTDRNVQVEMDRLMDGQTNR